MGDDWTWKFRKGGDGCVQEYVLLGEADYGCVAHPWFTYGNPLFDPSHALAKLRPGSRSQRWRKDTPPDRRTRPRHSYGPNACGDA